jgi:hypothetical protein
MFCDEDYEKALHSQGVSKFFLPTDGRWQVAGFSVVAFN